MCDRILCEFIKKDLKINSTEFSVEISDDFQYGGYVADIFFLVVTNRKTQEKKNIVLKKQKCQNNKPLEFTNQLFLNETHFFKKIWMKLFEFYKEKTGKLLDIVPKCLSVADDEIKKIVLENLAVQGFFIYDKTKSFEEEHIAKIFETFGRFHGVSMAFKNHNKEDYLQLLKPIYYKFKEDYKNVSVPGRTFQTLCGYIQKYFDPETETEVIKKLQLYQHEGSKLVSEAFDNDKNESVILHGDCWSNNIMLKKNVSNILQNSLKIHSLGLIEYFHAKTVFLCKVITLNSPKKMI